MKGNTVANLYAVDLAKFICAILVITIHVPLFGFEFGFGASSGPVREYLNYGISKYLARLAVPFFWAASGYLLYRKDRDTLFDNTKRYIVKLFKLYLIWTLIYSPLIIYNIVGSGEAGKRSLEFVQNFIFTGSYIHLWYLPATILAVFLVSCLLSRRVTIEKILVLGLLLYVLGAFDDSWYGVVPEVLQGPVQAYNKLFVTTRNGLFEGLLFVSIGAFFAIRRPTVRYPVIGLLASMSLLLVEAFYLKRSGIPRDFNFYFSLVPSIFFLFYIILNVNLKEGSCYLVLRKMSALIFFMHLWIEVLIKKIFSAIDSAMDGPGRFLLVVVCSVIISLVIISLSGTRRFRWLGKIF